jgi:hypothetical protein
MGEGKKRWIKIGEKLPKFIYVEKWKIIQD